jgi:pyrroloquinoline-quinone synthase
MNSKKYSSVDFTETKSQFHVEIPEKLIHKNVESKKSVKEDTFSRERKHDVFVVDLPTKTISMTIGGLEPGQSTNQHRHTYETVIYIVQGAGYSLIEGRKVEWNQGDAIYIPVWAAHSHHSTSQEYSKYIACENAPLLQNLGHLAIRQEE